MSFDDLRAFLRLLASEGQLSEPEASPAAVGDADAASPAEAERPAALFGPPAPSGGRLVVGVHGSPGRIARALGLRPSLSLDDAVAVAVERLGEAVQADYVAPSAAACKQVVLRGAAADLTRFPIRPAADTASPLVLDKALLVTRDPATGAVGLSLAELALLEARLLAVRPRLAGDFERHVAAARPLGAPLEVAVLLGNDPVLPLAAASHVPPADDAYLYASALRGQPLLITDCESTELEIPARTEIVLEGLAETADAPVRLAIHTITHRRDPIYEALRGGWAGAEAELLRRWAATIRARDPEATARAALGEGLP